MVGVESVGCEHAELRKVRRVEGGRIREMEEGGEEKGYLYLDLKMG